MIVDPYRFDALDSDRVFGSAAGLGTSLIENNTKFRFNVPGSGNNVSGKTNDPVVGKIYCEFVMTALPGAMSTGFGLMTAAAGSQYTAGAYMICAGTLGPGHRNDGALTADGAYAYGLNDVVGVAYDSATGKLWFSENGVWKSGDPAAGTSPTMTIAGSPVLYFAVAMYSYFIGSGQYDAKIIPMNFTYTPPLGFTGYNAM